MWLNYFLRNNWFVLFTKDFKMFLGQSIWLLDFTLWNMQILPSLHVSEDNNITIVHVLSHISILITRLNNKTNKFRPLRIQLDHIAWFVLVRAIFCAFKERLAIIMQQLNFISILDNFSFSPFENLFICFKLLCKFLL